MNETRLVRRILIILAVVCSVAAFHWIGPQLADVYPLAQFIFFPFLSHWIGTIAFAIVCVCIAIGELRPDILTLRRKKIAWRFATAFVLLWVISYGAIVFILIRAGA